MQRIKKFKIPLTDKDLIDVKIITEKNEVIGFVLNYRAKFEDVWYQVYRVDTCHRYLHEQRFWITPEPISLPRFSEISFKYVFDFYLQQIKSNYQRYRKYYQERMVLK
ncbi:MAG TPA: hypothetical protein EYP22_02875 [Methanosarcinales archaeon]|nr:hypothetical protein [Methanosarcinales archaeon]